MADPMKPWGWDSGWPAPAKLNLFLHVVGRRADGYHLLQTVFRFVDHGDLLYFSPRADGEVVLATPQPSVAPDDDLTVRAARLLQSATGCRQGVNIVLDKRLPLGGGLGGGSSDAATVLLALNHLWRLRMPRSALAGLGLRLGADVPVFIGGRNAFAEGVGEQLTPLALPPAWYVVIEPGVAVATVEMFRVPDLRRDTPPISPAEWRPGFGTNDLEPVARARYPEIERALVWLGQHAPARMTGSGACVFAEFPDYETARATVASLPEGWQGWLAAGLPEHPLHGIE